MADKQVPTIELVPEREKHLLIALYVPGMLAPAEEPLSELAELVETAGAEVVGQLYQKRHRPHSKTYLGKGKLQELVELVSELKPHTVVADSDLTPRQLKGLEEAVCTKVIDRSEVILDIFASHVRTHQARLQVSLAQMQYQLPRLGRKWTHLERLGGGIGTRGPGESQIETDRRILRSRILRFQSELKAIQQRKKQEVESRSKSYTVSLVGYTNSGKSTLMNALTNAGSLVADKLFATLDTLTRKMELEQGLSLLLSDTVGFIRRLPHHLVASFQATLEEAKQSRLLLHVVDASSPLAISQIRSVNQTLAGIDCRGREHLYLLNKTDKVQDNAFFQMLKEKYTPNISISATLRDNLAELHEYLQNKALEYLKRVSFEITFYSGDGRRLALLNQLGHVCNVKYDKGQVVVQAEIEATDLARLRRLPGEMQVTEISV